MYKTPISINNSDVVRVAILNMDRSKRPFFALKSPKKEQLKQENDEELPKKKSVRDKVEKSFEKSANSEDSQNAGKFGNNYN